MRDTKWDRKLELALKNKKEIQGLYQYSTHLADQYLEIIKTKLMIVSVLNPTEAENEEYFERINDDMMTILSKLSITIFLLNRQELYEFSQDLWISGLEIYEVVQDTFVNKLGLLEFTDVMEVVNESVEKYMANN